MTEQQQNNGGLLDGWGGYVIRFAIVYYAMQIAQRGIGSTTVGSGAVTPSAAVSQQQQQQQQQHPKMVVGHSPLWESRVAMDLKVYLSPDPSPNFTTMGPPVWHRPGLIFDESQEETSTEVRVPVTKALRDENGTLFLHAFFTRPGYSPDPQHIELGHQYHRSATFHGSVSLVRYYRAAVTHTAKNLISGKEEQHVSRRATILSGRKVGWWKPEMTICILHDGTTYPRGGIPYPMSSRFRQQTSILTPNRV